MTEKDETISVKIPMTPFRRMLIDADIDMDIKRSAINTSYLIEQTTKSYENAIGAHKPSIDAGEPQAIDVVRYLAYLSEIPYSQIEKLADAAWKPLMRKDPQLALDFMAEFQALALKRKELESLRAAAERLA